MLLTDVRVTNYRSIEDSGLVTIDPDVTIFVGQNESGKTVFLKALYASEPVENHTHYDITTDYPRKHLIKYRKQHQQSPAQVTSFCYELDEDEIHTINADLDMELIETFQFTVHHNYKNERTIALSIPEIPYIKALVKQYALPTAVKNKLLKQTTLRNVFKVLHDIEPDEESLQLLQSLQEKFQLNSHSWPNLLEQYIWTQHLVAHIPKFLYFDEYKLLPAKINLLHLSQRYEKDQLNEEEKTLLGLLRLADIDVDELLDEQGYEDCQAKLEGISNSITDQVFDYWKQKEDIEVQFDIKADNSDHPPFNQGKNLYIRIKNLRNRVSLPFNQRSEGFVWFFSFIAWFDSIKETINANRDIILLLDEPGIALHALAQADLLNYIDDLAQAHQIMYTTHSPFMLHSDKLSQVRMVEDKGDDGTKVSADISQFDFKTLYPLQASLAYKLLSDTLITPPSLLVPDVTDLLFLRFFSNYLQKQKRCYLDHRVTITPMGGIQKLAAFTALLKNHTALYLLLDYQKDNPEALQLLENSHLKHCNFIQSSHILNYALFRDAEHKKRSKNLLHNKETLKNSYIEDLLSEQLYFTLFNNAYAQYLEMPLDRYNTPSEQESIIHKIQSSIPDNVYLNRYNIALSLTEKPLHSSQIDTTTLDNFEFLFRNLNTLLLQKPV